jgi:Holliday junction resolvase RusA-like endonuclease
MALAPTPDISFTVWGTPAPKGSKSAFPIRRKSGRMGVAVVEGKTDRQKDWSRRIEEVVQGLAASGSPMLDGPLVASIEFFLPRPASAPKRRRTWPDRKPDLDKLLRAILDPMSGVLIADDARIVEFVGLSKNYASGPAGEAPRPCAVVCLWTWESYYGLPEQEAGKAAAAGRPTGGVSRAAAAAGVIAAIAWFSIWAFVPAGWWMR